MVRQAGLVLAMAALLGSAMLPTSAAAQRTARPDRPADGWTGAYDHGWPTGEWSFGYFGQYRSYNPLLGFGGYYGCWRTARVETPTGIRVYREWVCY